MNKPTAEDWLNKNGKKEDFDNLEEGLKDFIHTNNVLEYMDDYAQHYSESNNP